jgi:hypothetical protein
MRSASILRRGERWVRTVASADLERAGAGERLRLPLQGQGRGLHCDKSIEEKRMEGRIPRRRAWRSACVHARMPADARSRATEDFFELHQGKMILGETKSVSAAMLRFGHCLDETEQCGKGEINDRCRALATAMAGSMADTAKMSYQEFAANQFRYGPGR